MNGSVDQNALNTVLYALSTLAQTCAALAALVGALALYRLQGMRDDHTAAARAMTDLVRAALGRTPSFDEVLSVAEKNIDDPRSPFQKGTVDGLRVAMREWKTFEKRYAEAVRILVGFEGWNLLTILLALLGFACASWLASHWIVFVIGLIVLSVGSVVLTGGALYVMAHREQGTR